MKVLFPSRPGTSHEVDPAFTAERDAAAKAGFSIGYVDIAGAIFGDGITVSNVLKEDKALYRGWILRPELYRELATMVDLVTSPEEYERTYVLPKWYLDFGPRFTPPSSWIDIQPGMPIEEYVQLVCKVVKKDALRAPFVVKDYLKSRKHEWYDACFAETYADLTRVVTNFVTRQLQDNSFVGGVVVRECVPLAKIGVHPKTQQPLGDEVRVYFWEGEPLVVAPYWHDGVNAASDVASPMASKKLQDFLDQVKKFPIVRNHPFMSVDVGKLTDGTYTVIEIGDGGCSGIPESVSPDVFYSGIRAALNLKESFAQYFATMSSTKSALDAVNTKMDELTRFLAASPVIEGDRTFVSTTAGTMKWEWVAKEKRLYVVYGDGSRLQSKHWGVQELLRDEPNIKETTPALQESGPAPDPIEPSSVLRKRTCNRHADCAAADTKARSNGRYDFADHCYDDCCEDCFGC